jgi:N-carbamoyl-L-amino-acid hydrolase
MSDRAPGLENALLSAVEDLAPAAEALFQRVAELSDSGNGVTRAAYGEIETAAGAAVADFGRDNGLIASFDHVGNLQVVLGPSTERAIILGSHLDSVPNGGNFDGLAGVIAGVLVQAALRRSGTATANPVRTIGFRGEESPWFGTAYLGSKLLLGQFTADELVHLRRYDTGLSLLEHLRRLGHEVDNGVLQEFRLRPEEVRAYLELHIEQGPVLEANRQPLAVATAARGNIRYPFARCHGVYAHSAAVPRAYRSDAVLAVAKLMAFADERWQALIAEGNDDLVFTCGIFHTDPAEHAMTKVPGEVRFSINLGATSDAVMDALHSALLQRADALSREHRVRFDLGQRVGTGAVQFDAGFVTALTGAAEASGVQAERMPTVGHDAVMFARLGVPATVLLVRNQNGSHNPAEAMQMADFINAVKVLALGVARLAQA